MNQPTKPPNDPPPPPNDPVTGPATDPVGFLTWLEERFVNVYGESRNVDYLHRLRALRDRLAAPPKTLPDIEGIRAAWQPTGSGPLGACRVIQTLCDAVDALRSAPSVVDDATVDRVLFAVFNTADIGELWARSRQDPDTFRLAVRHAFASAAKPVPKAAESTPARRPGTVQEAVAGFLRDVPEDVRQRAIAAALNPDQAALQRADASFHGVSARTPAGDPALDAIGFALDPGAPVDPNAPRFKTLLIPVVPPVGEGGEGFKVTVRPEDFKDAPEITAAQLPQARRATFTKPPDTLTVKLVDDPPQKQIVMCPHGRMGVEGWKSCPHCLGLGALSPKPPRPTPRRHTYAYASDPESDNDVLLLGTRCTGCGDDPADGECQGPTVPDRATIEACVPWESPRGNPYVNDGANCDFELCGHLFVIRPSGDSGTNSGRTRWCVDCATCDENVHPGTTSATAQIRWHLEVVRDRWERKNPDFPRHSSSKAKNTPRPK